MMTAKQITSKNNEDGAKRGRVIELYLAMKKYGKPNQADIGRQVGLSRERVRQILKKAGLIE